MKLKVILRGIIKKHIPWLYNKLKKKGTGGTDTALYCYSVWLRHFVLLRKNGMNEIPKTVAELGPGDSLGIGLNALITGAETFHAFDIIKHADTAKNIKIFDELVELYKNKTNIPSGEAFDKVKPKLENYNFPSEIFSDNYLNKILNPERLQSLRKAIEEGVCGEFTIKYIVPWDRTENLESESVDLIYSQAVMEHVVNVADAYEKSFHWLKNGGLMSHEIDYSAHETHKKWYGHWTYPGWLWKIINNGRLYAINRFPNSYHLKSLKRNGFKIIYELPFINSKAISINNKLFKEFEFEERDLQISSCYIISQKPID